MESVLGVKGVLGAKPQSWLDWVAMMREGIPAAAVEPIIGAVHLSQAQLARLLGISERALARRMREGVLRDSWRTSALAGMRQRVVDEGLQLGRLLPSAGVVQVEPWKRR